MIAEVDIAWAAGFFEGEGHFSARARVTGLHVSQVNPEPLYRLQRLFGGYVYGPRFKRTSPIYVWQLNRRGEVAIVVARLLPWLSERRRAQWVAAQAKSRDRAFVAAYDARRNIRRLETGKAGPHQGKGRGWRLGLIAGASQRSSWESP